MLALRRSIRGYQTHLELRRNYLDHFEKNGHKIVASSSVLPGENDSSLLYTNAGMNQFKSKIMSSRESEKLANIQKCIRAGGKHNDLDDVGNDLHHQTFFEMMGNWSFNDAFSKKTACELALNYLVDNLKLDIDRLYFSYFSGSSEVVEDTECRQIWKDLGIQDSHILGFKDENFWEMGQSGPCGVCTEIHYDRIGGRDASKLVNIDDSVVEIWNIVFMSKLRAANGVIGDLGKHHIDTGMGFERLLSIVQSQNSNFDTDLFSPIFSDIHRLTSHQYKGVLDSPIDVAMRIIADHIRCVTIAMGDGLRPDVTDAGFVLRKMMRRMFLQSSRVLDIDRFGVSSLVEAVQKSLGSIYPEILNPQISKIIDAEEEQFWRIVDKTKTHFFKIANNSGPIIDGKHAFNLFETYGMPLEITVELARSVGKSVEVDGFEKAKKDAQNLSVSSSNHHTISVSAYDFPQHSDNAKYHIDTNVRTKILGICQNNQFVDNDETSGKCAIILEECQFYGEQGGQAADGGVLKINEIPIFRIDTVKKSADRKVTIIFGETLGEAKISKNLQVEQCLDLQRRNGLMRAHSATHLLNWSLRECGLGKEQRGSSVEDEYLRFDYSTTEHSIPDRFEALKNVEKMINSIIGQNLKSNVRLTSSPENLEFKKDRIVDQQIRIVSFDGDVAEECCSGTHVANTAQILDFAIMSDKSTAKGVRRIIATCGEKTKQCREYTASLLENGAKGVIDWKKVPLFSQKQVKEIVAKNKKNSKKISC